MKWVPFLIITITILAAGVSFAAAPQENEAVRDIVLRIEDRLAREDVRAIYSGIYLIWARGTADEVREAIAAGADPNAWEPQLPVHENPLHRRTMPPLALAAMVNPDVEALRVLLEAGADPNAGNSAGETPLHLAAGVSDPESIRILLEAGAHVDAVDEAGINAFHFLLSSMEGRETSRIEESLTLLLDAGLDPNAAAPNGTTPLHYFVERTNAFDAEATARLLSPLRMFVERGADVHKKVEGGYKPIWGLSRRHIGYDRVTSAQLPPHLVRLLVDVGFDIDSQNNKGSTIMMYCAGYFTRGDMLKKEMLHDFSALLDAGADPDIRDRQGKSAFDYLHPNAKRALLESGLGSRMGSPFRGFFALCADGSFADVEKALSDGGAVGKGDPDYLDTPPLSLAAFRNPDPDVVDLLLARGSNVNQTNAHGMTALHFAAVAGNTKVARLLLDAEADPNAADGVGNTPLHYAMRNAVPEKAGELAALLRTLRETGANPNAVNRRGERPLHMFVETATLSDEAAYAAFLPPLREFIATGADPDATDMDNRSPLFTIFTDFERRLPVWKVRLMAELGTNLDWQDKRGQTVLARTVQTVSLRSEYHGHEALRPGLVADVNFLLDLGADPGLLDDSGRIAHSHLSDKFPADHPLRARLKVRASYKGKYGRFRQSTPDEVREALASGFDPNGLTHWRTSYIADAVENPDPGVLVVFLEAGADPDQEDKDGKTALMIAADLRNSSAMTELLRHGARTDARDNIGMTAMHSLFRKLNRVNATDVDEFVACLRLLLDAGADPMVKSRYGQTPFDLFFHYFKAETRTPDLPAIARVLRELAERGVDFFEKNAHGMSAPVRALCEKKIPWRVIDLYRELGWDINEKVGFGVTPLMRAASFRNIDIHYGDNPVRPEDYVASGVVDGLADLFAGMMERGADPALRNDGGITALEHLAPELQEHLLRTRIGESLR